MSYKVKVREFPWEVPSFNELLTIEDSKRIMEMADVTSFTEESHESLVKMSHDFISKIIHTAVTYMQHGREFEVRVEHVKQSLGFHNLKFYGTGELCRIDRSEMHPAENLSSGLSWTPCGDYDEREKLKLGDFFDKINLAESFRKKCDENGLYDSNDEGSYEDEDILDSDDSTASSDLCLKQFSRERTLPEIKEQIIEDLEEAQEALDELEDDVSVLGETDDEEEKSDTSSWKCTGHLFELISNSPSRPERMFMRTKFIKMCKSFHTNDCMFESITPPALAILHQVFENYLFDQLSLNSQLRLEISNQVLKWRNQRLMDEIKELKSKQGKRKRGESLQSHFDVIDLTCSKRRVTP